MVAVCHLTRPSRLLTNKSCLQKGSNIGVDFSLEGPGLFFIIWRRFSSHLKVFFSLFCPQSPECLTFVESSCCEWNCLRMMPNVWWGGGGACSGLFALMLLRLSPLSNLCLLDSTGDEGETNMLRKPSKPVAISDPLSELQESPARAPLQHLEKRRTNLHSAQKLRRIQTPHLEYFKPSSTERQELVHPQDKASDINSTAVSRSVQKEIYINICYAHSDSNLNSCSRNPQVTFGFFCFLQCNKIQTTFHLLLSNNRLGAEWTEKEDDVCFCIQRRRKLKAGPELSRWNPWG